MKMSLIAAAFVAIHVVASVSANSVSARIDSACPDSPTQRAVLVTGASSGIGRKITERLAAEGYYVYATVRNAEDLSRLPAHENIRGLPLDVTRAQDITEAVDTIAREARGLYALINNAGVASVGSVAEMEQGEFDLVMAVNVAGPFRMTQAFLPLIRAQKGRIIAVSSMAAFVACPGLSAYCMSKAAVESFTDALAEEMKPHGVHVSVIEPGRFKSDIFLAAAERGIMDRRFAEQWKSEQKDPDEVAEAAVLALSDASPKRRYMVSPNASEAEVVIHQQIARLVQLNEGHAYTHDRDVLIKMINEALAGARPRTR